MIKFNPKQADEKSNRRMLQASKQAEKGMGLASSKLISGRLPYLYPM